MSFGSVAGITLAIAAVIVLGVTLMSYVSSLVKNAYQIKVELRGDVDKAIASMTSELARNSKALRKELGDDASKVREGFQKDVDRRVQEIEERLAKAQGERSQEERALVQDMRHQMQDMTRRLKTLERDMAALKEDSQRRAAIGRALRDRQQTAEAAPSAVDASAPLPLEADVPHLVEDMPETSANAKAPPMAVEPRPEGSGDMTGKRYSYQDFKA